MRSLTVEQEKEQERKRRTRRRSGRILQKMLAPRSYAAFSSETHMPTTMREASSPVEACGSKVGACRSGKVGAKPAQYRSSAVERASQVKDAELASSGMACQTRASASCG